VRPHEYTQEKLELARDYLDGGWELEGDAVPQIAGLAMAMGVCRQTVYNWGAESDKPEFLDIFTRVLQLQERKLINGGLKEQFNPAITKMMLTKHGYTDKQAVDHTSSDKSMSPKTELTKEQLAEELQRRGLPPIFDK